MVRSRIVMKLFLKEHWSLIALQVIQSFLLLSVIWLAGFRNCSILTYSLLLYFAIFCFYLLYKYMTRRKLYHLLQQTMNHLDDALQKKSTRLNSSHVAISYAVFCLKK